MYYYNTVTNNTIACTSHITVTNYVYIKGHHHLSACTNSSNRNLESSGGIFQVWSTNSKWRRLVAVVMVENSARKGRFRDEIKQGRGWQRRHRRTCRNEIYSVVLWGITLLTSCWFEGICGRRSTSTCCLRSLWERVHCVYTANEAFLLICPLQNVRSIWRLLSWKSSFADRSTVPWRSNSALS